MILTLARIKQRLGIDDMDFSHDDALSAAGGVVTQWFERYCGRGIEYRAGEEQRWVGRRVLRHLFLHRYPIAGVTGVTVDGQAVDLAELVLDVWSGIVYRRGDAIWMPATDIVVQYAGGYQTDDVPEDLADAFARCVGVKSGYGVGDAGGPSGAPIRQLGLGGGAISIAFDTSRADGAGMSGAWDVGDAPPELQPYTTALQFYRRLGV